MNRITKILVALIIIFFISSKELMAQNLPEATVKSTLTSLLDYSKSKSYDKAAKLIAYNGEDSKRVNIDAYNPSNKEELNQVKRVCKKINALLELSSTHEFGDFRVTGEKGKEEYTIHVTFVSGSQKLVTAFSFIKTEKGFLLTNMN